MSYYDNTTASKLFYGLDFALKMSISLNNKPELRRNPFILEVLKLGEELSNDSHLLPILHVFVQNADLMLFDEPFSNLRAYEKE